MFYVFMVSHGEFAPGLHTAAKMIVGDRKNMRSTSLRDGMSAADFVQNVKEMFQGVQSEDRIVLLGDIIGGSPLTTAVDIMSKKCLMKNAKIIGGMSLPMVITAILMGENLENQSLVNTLLSESRNAIREFVPEISDEVEDI